MTKTLKPKILLSSIVLCLLCCLSMPAFAQGDDDSDNPPDSNPPKLSYASTAVASQSACNLELVFLEEADNVQVEVCDTNGTVTQLALVAVDANSRLSIDARRWKRGSYTVRVTVRGKPVSVTRVQLK